MDGGARPPALPIIREEARKHGYTVEQLISPLKIGHLTHVRQYAMWRARKETGRTWWEIARLFQRDHTTVMHAFWKIENKPPEQREVFAKRVYRKPRTDCYGSKFKGNPCGKGHVMRYLSSGRYVQCKLENDRKSYDRRFHAEAAE